MITLQEIVLTLEEERDLEVTTYVKYGGAGL